MRYSVLHVVVNIHIYLCEVLSEVLHSFFQVLARQCWGFSRVQLGEVLTEILG